MKLSHLADRLNLSVYQGDYDDHPVKEAYTSDLLSDVMAHAGDSGLLITVQAHKNSVAVAGLSGMHGIILCNGRSAPQDMIDAARAESIGIFGTQHNQYTVSWQVHDALNG